MLEAWARAYAERWGLPGAAVEELHGVIEAVRHGQVSDGQASTRPYGAAGSRGSAGGVGMVALETGEPERPQPPPLPEELVAASLLDAGARYEDMGPIGEGGMGEVRRVWDSGLQRAVAMKVLRRDLADRDDLVHRFIEEAQATGQLEHPGIVPVYDFGRLPDGRPYFTMKEIRGRSLLDVIEEVHQESDGSWGVTPSGWSFHRLISVFQQVCEAVAYAHSRGVLHRDMKPTNVMVGAFGEVVVMDWGLAKIAAAAAKDLGKGVRGSGTGKVVTARSRGALYVTRSGSVAGTPNYMPPEQARGEHGLIGPWSDVYALGALLYEILADRAPYEGEDLDEVVQMVLAAPPPVPYPRWQDRDEPSQEDGLRAIVAKAMAREIAGRYMDAGTLAEAVSTWLENAGVRDRAMMLVKKADDLEPELTALRKRAATLRAQAAGVLGGLPADAPPDQKRAGWALEDEAVAIDADLQRKQVRYANLLHAALAGVPDLPEAQQRLDQLGEVDRPGAATTGDGWLTLTCEPTQARVTFRRIEPVDRRLVAVAVPGMEPLKLPIDRLKLPAGAWHLRIDAEGCDPLVVLAQVRPGELWSVAPAGTTRPQPVRPAPAGTDPGNTVRVPAGWFWCGGDRELADSLPRSKVWVDAFLVQVHPVTCEAFVEFLNALDEAGGGAEADRLAPAGVGRDPHGAFTLAPDWEPSQPARRVTFAAARAYAAWYATATGRPWRLPREREWEKAARGVDERLYPWGNFLDPAWCCIADSHRGRPPRPASVHDYGLDTSPYGVRGMGGNVRDWVLDDRAPRSGEIAPEHRLVKGGHYLGIAQFARCALRYRMPVPADDSVGFRLVCSVA